MPTDLRRKIMILILEAGICARAPFFFYSIFFSIALAYRSTISCHIKYGNALFGSTLIFRGYRAVKTYRLRHIFQSAAGENNLALLLFARWKVICYK